VLGKLGSIASILAVAVVAVLVAQDSRDPIGDKANRTWLCVKVLSGDTIELENGLRIHYLGTVERSRDGDRTREHWILGSPTDANRELVEGKPIRLEVPRGQDPGHEVWEAYVWLGNALVNERLVRLGWLDESRDAPAGRYSAILHQAANYARDAERYAWADPPSPVQHVTCVGADLTPPCDGLEVLENMDAHDKELLVRRFSAIIRDSEAPAYVNLTAEKYHLFKCPVASRCWHQVARICAEERGYRACSICGAQ